jgi:hypothetical protein
VASDSSFIKNEESVSKFLALCNTDYDRFKTDRESLGIEETMELADGMWRCMQNSTLADAEREASSGAPENRASVGSVRFFRTVSQKASLGYSVSSSVEVPFNYRPRANQNIWGSDMDGQGMASVHNALARYAWRQGGCDRKMYEFWHQIHKYCNVPVQIRWKETQKRMLIKDQESGKREYKEVITDIFPEFRSLHWSMLYADVYTPNIKDQNCVIVLSVVPWTDLQNGAKLKWYDEDVLKEMKENRTKYRWDGNEGSAFRKEQSTNAGSGSYSPGDSDLYLVWDIYRWMPIKNGKFEDAEDYQLYWCTAVGNSLTQAKLLRADTDFDPDGEIPIEMIRAIPDDNDLLYSMSWAQVIRTAYSIESTLWEQAIDNIAGVNNPVMLYNSMKFNTKPGNFLYQPGAKWDVNDIEGAIKEFAPRDTTSTTTQLIALIQGEQGVGTSMNSNMMGQEYGGRTSASEGIAINRFSQQPNLAETSYILNQLTALLAKKFKSYFQAFGNPRMLHMIADEEMNHQLPVEAEDSNLLLYGDFDIETDIADQFVEDYVAAGQEIQLIQTMASNPILLESKTHKVDVGEWLTGILRRLKVHNASSIIRPVTNIDARLRQRDEIRVMIETKQFIQPQEGEDHNAHIGELNAAIMEWKPLAARVEFEAGEGLQKELEFAKFVLQELLIPHLEAHQMMTQQEGMQAQAMQQSGSAKPQMTEQTPGQEAGNVAAGELGSLQQ